MPREVAIFDPAEASAWPCGGRCQPELWAVGEWGCTERPNQRGDICSLGADHDGKHMVCDPDSHDPALHAVLVWESDCCPECDGHGEFEGWVPWITQTCPYCGGSGMKGEGRL